MDGTTKNSNISKSQQRAPVFLFVRAQKSNMLDCVWWNLKINWKERITDVQLHLNEWIKNETACKDIFSRQLLGWKFPREIHTRLLCNRATVQFITKTISTISSFHVTRRPSFEITAHCMEQMCLHEWPLIISHRQAFIERTDRNHHSLITDP